MTGRLLIDTLSPLLLKPLQQHLIGITLFRLLKLIYSQSVLSEHMKNFSSVFPKPMDRSIYKTKFQHMSAFLFPCSISCITLTLPLMLKTFLPFMTVSMLSHYSLLLSAEVGQQRQTLHTKKLLLLLSLSRHEIYMAI